MGGRITGMEEREDIWLTRSQAALIAGVSERTIDRWLRDPAVDLNIYRPQGAALSTVRISRAELAEVVRVVRSPFETRAADRPEE